LSLSEAGDEPLLIARRLPSVPVLAGADRAAVGRRAVEEFGVDSLVMDDGFQHLRLFRNVNILCLDAMEVTALFERGGAALLPAGRLREPLSALWRADVVLLTRAEGLAPSKVVSIRRKVEECLLDVPVVPVFATLSFREHAGGEAVEPSSLKGRPVFAVSGLARPESFENALRRLGMKVKARRFPDHHLFSPDERKRLVASAKADGRRIVVTEKDAIRLPDDFPCLVARLEWMPEETKTPEKGDITPYARTVPWTQRIDSVIS
jgi:tetraacyldisaccharide 4'-kinase